MPLHEGEDHGGVAGAAGEVIRDDNTERAEDREEDLLGVSRVRTALTSFCQTSVGKPEHHYHSQERPDIGRFNTFFVVYSKIGFSLDIYSEEY